MIENLKAQIIDLQNKNKFQQEQYEAKLKEQEKKYEAQLTSQQNQNDVMLMKLQVKLAEQQKQNEIEKEQQERKYEAQLNDQKKKYEAQLNEQKRQYEAQLNEQKKIYEAQLTSQQNQSDAMLMKLQVKLAEQQKQNEIEKEQQERKYEAQLNEQKRKYETQLNEQKKKYEAQLVGQNNTDIELKKLEEQLTDEKTIHKLQLEELKARLTVLQNEKMQHESQLNKQKRQYEAKLAEKNQDVFGQEQIQTQLNKLQNQNEIQRKQYEAQLSEQKKLYEAQLNEQKRLYETQLNKQNQNDIEQNQTKTQLNEQKEKYEGILNELQKQSKIQKEQLQAQLADKEEELKQMQQKLDEIIKQNDSTNGNKFTTHDLGNLKILDKSTIDELETICEIGSGGGGRVMKVAKKEIFALKIMNISKNAKENYKSYRHFMSEHEIMNMLNHPNILHSYGIFMSEKDPPSILLEYCPLNLEDVMNDKTLPKVKIVCIIYQIIEGMKYVHFRKVIHRDLKPSNILITLEGTVKICDFGISKLMTTEQQVTTERAGTQKYMAPEILNEDNYNEKADVYSFGVLAFTILNNGKLPDMKMRDILLGNKANIPSSFTDTARNIIDSCWNFKPEERPSFEQILNTLTSNKYNIVELNESELNEVETFVENHKTKIPSY